MLSDKVYRVRSWLGYLSVSACLLSVVCMSVSYPGHSSPSLATIELPRHVQVYLGIRAVWWCKCGQERLCERRQNVSTCAFYSEFPTKPFRDHPRRTSQCDKWSPCHPKLAKLRAHPRRCHCISGHCGVGGWSCGQQPVVVASWTFE